MSFFFSVISLFSLPVSLCILQKGTVVEKLVEEKAKNDQHLRHLISICEGRSMKLWLDSP